MRSIKRACSAIRSFSANRWSPRITNVMTVQSEATLFLKHDPQTLAVVSEARGDYFQKYLAGMRHLRDTVVVTVRYSRLLLEHLDGISATSPIFQMPTTASSSLYRRPESPFRVILNSLTRAPSGLTPFPVAQERLVSDNSSIVS